MPGYREEKRERGEREEGSWLMPETGRNGVQDRGLVPWLRVGMWVTKIVPILPSSQGLRDCGTALDNGVDR